MLSTEKQSGRNLKLTCLTFPGAVTILCLQEALSRLSESLQSRKTLIFTAFKLSLRSAAVMDVEARSVGRDTARPLTTDRKKILGKLDHLKKSFDVLIIEIFKMLYLLSAAPEYLL